MESASPTREELLDEVHRLRQRVEDLEEGEVARRQTEEALVRQALVLQSILESIGDGVVAADTQGNFFIVNSAAREISGLAEHFGPEEWAGSYGIFRPDKQTRYRAEELPILRAVRGEAVDQEEQFVRNPFLPPEGRWLNSTARPLRDGQGNLLGGVVVFRDVTQQKQEEAALRESEERFRSFMDNSPAVAFLKDEAGRYVYYNEPHCRFFRHGKEEWLGKTVRDVYPAEVARRLEEADRWVQASGSVQEVQEIVPAPDGTPHEWITFKFPVEGADGEHYVGGVAVDITKRRQAEEALRTSEERFRSLSDCCPVGIFQTDAQAQVIYVNPRCRAITGWSFEEVAGLNWVATVDPRDRDRVVAEAVAAAEGGRGSDQELRIQRKDGTTAWIHVRTVAIVAADGARAGQIGTVEDITDRQEAEAQLQDYAQRLRALSRRLLEVQEQERRHFARELHDEIGQLLTGLKFSLDMVQRSPDGQARPFLGEAQGLVRDLTARVRDLSLRLRPTMLDDLGLLPALLWLLDRFTAQTQVEVAFEKSGIDRRFPPEVETAAYRIAQEALTNVARHAGARRAMLRVWLEGEVLNVQVEDEGAGFDAAAVQAAGPSSGISGMHERVSLLGGRLRIDAEPGRGTTVLASLPIERPIAG